MGPCLRTIGNPLDCSFGQVSERQPLPLEVDNRINVALTRARHGMFIVGNTAFDSESFRMCERITEACSLEIATGVSYVFSRVAGWGVLRYPNRTCISICCHLVSTMQLGNGQVRQAPDGIMDLLEQCKLRIHLSFAVSCNQHSRLSLGGRRRTFAVCIPCSPLPHPFSNLHDVPSRALYSHML